jgi:hypothetical protein
VNSSIPPQAEGMTVKPGFGAHQIRHHRHSDFLFVGSTHPVWPPFEMLFELPQSQVERVRSNRCESILEPVHPNDAAISRIPPGWPWRLTASPPISKPLCVKRVFRGGSGRVGSIP